MTIVTRALLIAAVMLSAGIAQAQNLPLQLEVLLASAALVKVHSTRIRQFDFGVDCLEKH